MKATLAKKELQETFLEFDLLGVVKRWLQVREACMAVLRGFSRFSKVHEAFISSVVLDHGVHSPLRNVPFGW